MKYNLLFKFFSALLLVSLMNFSLISFARAMGEEERETLLPLKQTPPSSPSNSSEENGSEEAISPRESVLQIKKGYSLELLLAYSKKPQRKDLDKSFFKAFSALEMDLDPDPSRVEKYGPPIGAIMIATGAAAALAEMYMFDSGVGILFGATPGETFYDLPPTPELIAGVFAGGLVLITAPFQMRDCLAHMTHVSSKYKAKAEPEKSLSKKIVLKFLIGVTCGVLSIKSVFAFVQTNINHTTSSKIFGATVGPVFALYKLLSAHHMAQEKWTLIYQWCGEKIDKFRGKIRPGEEERDYLRRRFANSFRKLIFDKADDEDKTKNLFDDVNTLHKAGKQQLNLWDQEIKALQKKLSKTSTQEERASLQSAIDALQKSRDAFQRVLTLATLKLLFDFDKEESSFPEHLRDPKWYGSHPWWYRAAQGSGVVLGGLSTYAIWYSWKYVLNTFIGTYFEHHPGLGEEHNPYILPNGFSNTFATTLTLFYGPYLTSASVSVFENLACSVMNYNPAENNPYIENPNITYPRARGIATFLNWCSHTFQEIPAALVGGSGMGWAGTPLAQQWWTLAPYMAAMGAGGHVLSGEVLQKEITKLMNRFERSKGGIDAKKQFLADLLKLSDDWLKTLRGEYVRDLKDLLVKDFEDLFKVDLEEDEEVFVDAEEGVDSYSSDDSGFFRGDDDMMRRPAQEEGLTAPLLESHTPRRSPSGIRGWFSRHVIGPFQKLFKKKRGADDFEMLEIYEV